MTEVDQQYDIEDEIRAAVASGTDVHRHVKAITLKALTRRQLDIKNIQQVIEAVGKGINEGMANQGEHGKEVFMQAATALDDALAIAAEASKLAIEEAASRVNEYSQHDLNDAINDLQSMEGSFLDSLGKIAKSGNQVVAGIVGDFIAHAGQSGTAVGKQTLTAMDAMKDLPGISKNILVSGTVIAASTLAQIGSGILLGIAESLQSPPVKK